MKRQPKENYRIYPTVLDAYGNYLNSDAVYERYWGFLENPPFTLDEFRERQFSSLIDRINRKPFDSEAADRGTAFGELVDCMVENRDSSIMEIEDVYKVDVGAETDLDTEESCVDVEYTDEVIGKRVIFGNREFTFSIDLLREFADYFKGAITQLRVEAPLRTAYGNVLVYGVIDELLPISVHDIKTTGSYRVGKFKSHHQHLIYPYALMKNGSDVRTFEYNIAELDRNGRCRGTYTETYVFEPQRDIPVLKERVEAFIQFLEENKELITDERIFGK